MVSSLLLLSLYCNYVANMVRLICAFYSSLSIARCIFRAVNIARGPCFQCYDLLLLAARKQKAFRLTGTYNPNSVQLIIQHLWKLKKVDVCTHLSTYVFCAVCHMNPKVSWHTVTIYYKTTRDINMKCSCMSQDGICVHLTPVSLYCISDIVIIYLKITYK